MKAGVDLEMITLVNKDRISSVLSALVFGNCAPPLHPRVVVEQMSSKDDYTC